ncbi:Ribonuclease e inhibitor rraa dimethylmenaquinone methyltransferase [Fusarium albosuccineum]|uniref:Ribonuclease e inhibitor rraa dimethylmenaquinone methyltransferase n=1 Tax=Fusarium albosuccineum TaxID=1237068 RepID=A0A8H4LM75_9HYPO|nr:Ribonuclease e inhibitor rraa dimethylmenaquinone methyltransferase [Fusarium albosuccineum]
MSLAATIKRLGAFASCDIGDALVKLKYPYGGFLDGIHMWSPAHRSGTQKAIGQAVTVKMVTMSDTSAPKPDRHFAEIDARTMEALRNGKDIGGAIKRFRKA